MTFLFTLSAFSQSSVLQSQSALRPLTLRPLAPGRGFRIGALSFLSAAALAMPMQLASQEQQDETFSVPTSTPTPSPSRAPQGPADERFGVPIGPRVIPQPTRTPPASTTPAPTPAPNGATTGAPTPAPTRAPTQTSTPAPAATQTRAAPSPQASQPAPARSEPAARPDVRNPNAQGAGIGVEDTAGPGFDSLGEDPGATAPRSADGWYSVDEAGAENAASAVPPASASQNAIPLSTSTPSLWDRLIAQTWLLVALVALIAAFGGIIAIVWLRRKRETEATLEAPATVLTAGVRASMGEEVEAPRNEWTEPKPQPAAAPTAPEAAPTKAVEPLSEQFAEPVAEPVAEPLAEAGPEPTVAATKAPPPIAPSAPPKVELALDIANASRSLMRLTVDFSLEIKNLSQHPLKDLSIAGELACAQEGAASPAPIDKSMPITTVERIAPQQSRRIKGTVQLPVSDITAISQNGRPVVIPLIHFRLDIPDQPTMTRSFVLGTPSATSPTRVHPLVLDGPPGSLPPLRAQLIKHS